MPTYRNISQEPITSVYDINNEYVVVEPFKEVQSYIQIINPNLLKIDEKPFYNPVIQSNTVILTLTDPALTNKLIKINEKCSLLEVINNSTNVIVYLYFQSLENTPGMKILPKTTKEFVVDKILYNKIILTANGNIANEQLFVNQYRKLKNDYM